MPDLDSVLIRRLGNAPVWLQTGIMETATSLRVEDAVIPNVPILKSAGAFVGDLPAGSTVLVAKMPTGVIVLGPINANYVPPTPPDESWKPLTLQNGWAPLGSGFVLPEVRKIGTTVQMRGVVAGGNAALGVPIGITPVGYRPTTRYIVPTQSNGATARIDIVPDGLVVCDSGCVSAWVSLGATWATN